MTVGELMRIVQVEELATPVLYGEGNRENAVVLEREGEIWKAYLTDERTGMFEKTLRTFDNESEALEYVLLKLRQGKKAHQSIASLFKNKRKPSKPTHVRQINGAHREAFLDDTRPYPEKIRFTLSQMDGSSFWSFALWRVPEGTDFSKDIPESDEYMLCTGSAEAMIIEVHNFDPDDHTVVYRLMVGKPGDYDGEPSEVVSWDDGRQSISVYPSELFTADEAASIMYGYFEAKAVAKFYRFRPLGVIEGIGTNPDAYDVSSTDVKKQQLNHALVAYLGWGRSSFPRHDEAAAKEFMAASEEEELLAQVKSIVAGCVSVEIDWSTHTLSEAGDEVRRVMAARYPELNDDALDALRWEFTYSNK